MGRPKGSKNKNTVVEGNDVEEAEAPVFEEPEEELPATEYLEPHIPSPRVKEQTPDRVTMALTDEDLEPARKAQANHARAAAKFQTNEIASELRRKEIGEIEELSVPQVVAFDLSAAFNKAALTKARAAGYRFALNLRKTPEGWMFEASKSPKVIHDTPAAE